jgi:predicted AAA+ superfamily ATPase
MNDQASSSTFINELLSQESLMELQKKWQHTLARVPKTFPSDIYTHMFFGGFPEVALKKQERFCNRWYASYLASYVERDIRDLSRDIDIELFGKTFRLLGARSGSLLNHQSLGSDAGVDYRTVQKYIELLQTTFQIQLLKPWHSNANKRLVKTPKVHLIDSGLVCYFEGIATPEALKANRNVGLIAETWVWSEIRKQLCLEVGVQTHFYRDHRGTEVDFVLTRGSRTCGVEFKLSKTIGTKDFAGLEALSQLSGDDFCGILLYLGDQFIPYSPKIMAVPLGCLIF